MTELEIFFLTQERGAKTDLAKIVGVSKTWISQIISGKMQPSAQLAIKIELATGVPRGKLRPDLFGNGRIVRKVPVERRVEVPVPNQPYAEVALQEPSGGGELAVRVDDGLPAV